VRKIQEKQNDAPRPRLAPIRHCDACRTFEGRVDWRLCTSRDGIAAARLAGESTRESPACASLDSHFINLVCAPAARRHDLRRRAFCDRRSRQISDLQASKKIFGEELESECLSRP
jgi:hypothetical protein